MQHKIEAIQLELTNACGPICAECPRRYMTRKVGMMDFELAKLIALETLKYNYYAGFNLNGLGEPLLYSYLPEFIEYLCSLKKDVHFDLFTGLVADPEQIKRVVRVIKDSKCDVTLAMTYHPFNSKGEFQEVKMELMIKNFLELYHELGSIERVHKHIALIKTKYVHNGIEKEFVERFRQMLPDDNIHVIKNMNPWLDLVKEMAGEDGYDTGCLTPSVCDYPFILPHVLWDGTICICCTDDVQGECTFGKIEKEEDLTRIWNCEALTRIRHLFKNSFEFPEGIELPKHYLGDEIKSQEKTKQIMEPCNKCNRTAWLRL